jgi:peptidoglycan-associated lipoprotein
MRRTNLLFFLVAGIAAGLVLNGCPRPKPEVEPEQQVIDTGKTEVKPPETKTEPPIQEMLREEQLQTVYFDFDKYNLRPDAKASLDANAQLLLKYTTVVIKIEGHCDERGTVEYNLGLGEKRANAVMDYLTGLGVAASRVSVISYGKERPVDAGHDESAWSKNRRAEFRVVSQ